MLFDLSSVIRNRRKYPPLWLRRWATVNMLKTEPLESLVPEYKRFFLEFTGKEYSDDLALKDLQTHPVFNLEEQKALFDDSKGQSSICAIQYSNIL